MHKGFVDIDSQQGNEPIVLACPVTYVIYVCMYRKREEISGGGGDVMMMRRRQQQQNNKKKPARHRNTE